MTAIGFDTFEGQGARRRAISFVAAAMVVALFCTLLWLASRSSVFSQSSDTASVEVFIQTRPETRPPPTRASVPGVISPAAPTPTTRPEADPALAQMLHCFNPSQRGRDPRCPTLQQRGDGLRTNGQIAIGPQQLPPLTYGFTRGEQMSPDMYHYQKCEMEPGQGPVRGAASICASLPDPPPPSRTAEEICEGGGLGPCHPPPPPTPAPRTP